MAHNPQLSYAAVNAQADALAALCNNGKLRIYSGSVPVRADDSIGAAVQLAELTMGATAFGAASNGVITANAITQDSAADASGTASFFRIWNTAGTTCYLQGTVGTVAAGTEDLQLNSVVLSAGAAVSVSALAHTVVRGA